MGSSMPKMIKGELESEEAYTAAKQQADNDKQAILNGNDPADEAERIKAADVKWAATLATKLATSDKAGLFDRCPNLIYVDLGGNYGEDKTTKVARGKFNFKKDDNLKKCIKAND